MFMKWYLKFCIFEKQSLNNCLDKRRKQVMKILFHHFQGDTNGDKVGRGGVVGDAENAGKKSGKCPTRGPRFR
uniref:Uncharacterized protein n=1 Tax=Cucumis melo TaxID=3656 RepID=A0A9I9E7P6_CUCME